MGVQREQVSIPNVIFARPFLVFDYSYLSQDLFSFFHLSFVVVCVLDEFFCFQKRQESRLMDQGDGILSPETTHYSESAPVANQAKTLQSNSDSTVENLEAGKEKWPYAGDTDDISDTSTVTDTTVQDWREPAQNGSVTPAALQTNTELEEKFSEAVEENKRLLQRLKVEETKNNKMMEEMMTKQHLLNRQIVRLRNEVEETKLHKLKEIDADFTTELRTERMKYREDIQVVMTTMHKLIIQNKIMKQELDCRRSFGRGVNESQLRMMREDLNSQLDQMKFVYDETNADLQREHRLVMSERSDYLQQVKRLKTQLALDHQLIFDLEEQSKHYEVDRDTFSAQKLNVNDQMVDLAKLRMDMFVFSAVLLFQEQLHKANKWTDEMKECSKRNEVISSVVLSTEDGNGNFRSSHQQQLLRN